MRTEYPDWATKKQLKGMKKFAAIAEEYGQFEIKFKQYPYSKENHQFIAELTWGFEGDNENGIRKHELRVGWNYEQTWDCYGDEIKDWQFIFAQGDATREMTTEILFLDLFFYLDKITISKAA